MSVLSAVSPQGPNEFKFAPTIQHENISSSLKQIELSQITEIAKTLQGKIYRAEREHPHMNNCNDRYVVIKAANKQLHNSSSALVNGKIYKCSENIIIESNIVKHLTQQLDCPKSIVKFVDFLETESTYLFVMEFGGNSLFSFIRNVHKLIADKKIEISHWRDVSQVLFTQMVECIDFIHRHNIVHFDLSLENFLINNVKVNVKLCKTKGRRKQVMEFVLDDIQIKICDFGLAKIFPSSNTMCGNFVGKSNYKSPENAIKQEFNAKKNDIWSLGICLFCIVTGVTPFTKAVESDTAFKFVMVYNRLKDLLNSWKVLHYFDENLFDLMCKFFQFEQFRIDLDAIKNHNWLTDASRM